MDSSIRSVELEMGEALDMSWAEGITEIDAFFESDVEEDAKRVSTVEDNGDDAVVSAENGEADGIQVAKETTTTHPSRLTRAQDGPEHSKSNEADVQMMSGEQVAAGHKDTDEAEPHNQLHITKQDQATISDEHQTEANDKTVVDAVHGNDFSYVESTIASGVVVVEQKINQETASTKTTTQESTTHASQPEEATQQSPGKNNEGSEVALTSAPDQSTREPPKLVTEPTAQSPQASARSSVDPTTEQKAALEDTNMTPDQPRPESKAPPSSGKSSMMAEMRSEDRKSLSATYTSPVRAKDDRIASRVHADEMVVHGKVDGEEKEADATEDEEEFADAPSSPVALTDRLREASLKQAPRIDEERTREAVEDEDEDEEKKEQATAETGTSKATGKPKSTVPMSGEVAAIEDNAPPESLAQKKRKPATVKPKAKDLAPIKTKGRAMRSEVAITTGSAATQKKLPPQKNASAKPKEGAKQKSAPQQEDDSSEDELITAVTTTASRKRKLADDSTKAPTKKVATTKAAPKATSRKRKLTDEEISADEAPAVQTKAPAPKKAKGTTASTEKTSSSSAMTAPKTTARSRPKIAVQSKSGGKDAKKISQTETIDVSKAESKANARKRQPGMGARELKAMGLEGQQDVVSSRKTRGQEAEEAKAKPSAKEAVKARRKNAKEEKAVVADKKVGKAKGKGK